MKRDWDLIRRLMLEIEDMDVGQHLSPHRIGEHSADVVGYHIHLMGQAGLIEWSSDLWNGDTVVTARNLTLCGHDLLDRIRDERTWDLRKMFMLERFGGISFEALTLSGGQEPFDLYMLPAPIDGRALHR